LKRVAIGSFKLDHIALHRGFLVLARLAAVGSQGEMGGSRGLRRVGMVKIVSGCLGALAIDSKGRLLCQFHHDSLMTICSYFATPPFCRCFGHALAPLMAVECHSQA